MDLNSIYDKNMAALRDTHPDLAKWIDNQPNVDWVKAVNKQLYITVGTVAQPVYDLAGMQKELDTIAGMPLHKENVSVFVGFGLGHTVNAAVEKMEKVATHDKRNPHACHHIVVVEPVGDIYRLALSHYDFSAAIRNRTLLFAPGKAEVDALTAWLDQMKVVADWLVLADRTCLRRVEYARLAEHTMDVLGQVQCNTGTITSAGAKIADNDIATLPWVIRHRGVAELAGLFAGKPAVCVSTGPSLARNIHVLKAWQDKVVIVAVGQALRPLLAYDIRPDFICTVDFGEVNMTHYAGLCDEDVPLVTINKTYAPLLKAYRGPKFISAAGGAPGSTHAVLNGMGELPQGGSVAHMVFGLAANLGCSPIIMIGQDLALGTSSHFNQADSMGSVNVVDGMIKWKVDDPRSATLHGRDDIGMGPAVYTPGWWGQPVLTNTGLLTFITSMKRLVAQYPGEVVNCTEGGCHIEGTHRMFLADVVEKYCGEVVDKSVIAPLLSLSPDADKRITDVLPRLRADIIVLDEIIGHSEKGLAAGFKMRATDNVKKLKKLMADGERHSNAAFTASKKVQPVGLAIYAASRRIQGRDLNTNRSIDYLIDPWHRKDLETSIGRNNIILTAARDAAKSLKATYAECESMLSIYVADKAGLDSTGETRAADIADADHYFAAGNFAKPLLEARRILNDSTTDQRIKDRAYDIAQSAYKIRYDKTEAAKAEQANDYAEKKNLTPQYLDLIEESRTAGRDDKNMDAAITKLKAAIALLPDREEALWGMASALLHALRWPECIAAYKTLVDKFPDKVRYEFEYGQALLLGGETQAGLDTIKSAMSKSTEFDSFFGALARLYADQGLVNEAYDACRVHLEKYPDDPDVNELLENLKECRLHGL